MPKKLYDKEQILDDCLTVFAQHGYKKTSTVMLAKAANISRTLIFHHFNNKKELYLSLLDRCFEKVSLELDHDFLFEHCDFFEARKQLSTVKFNYYQKNPDMYKIIMEAFSNPPEELKREIEEKYGELIRSRDKVMEQLFNQVPLREGVDRKQAFELIKVTIDYFENKYLSQFPEDKDWKETYHHRLIEERNQFLDMIQYGIQDRGNE